MEVFSWKKHEKFSGFAFWIKLEEDDDLLEFISRGEITEIFTDECDPLESTWIDVFSRVHDRSWIYPSMVNTQRNNVSVN